MNLRGNPAPMMLSIAFLALASAAHANRADLVDSELDPVVVTARGVNSVWCSHSEELGQFQLGLGFWLGPRAFAQVIIISCS